ncbi:hypothetical protein H5T87_01840 [bacterium]|nr:hypothetical protein [bacterium]
MNEQEKEKTSERKEGFKVTRREFLGYCASLIFGGLFFLQGGSAFSQPVSGRKANGKANIPLIFTHTPSEVPTWPHIGYDYNKRAQELTEKLASACPDINFTPFHAMNAEEANRILQETKDADGYVVYIVGIWTGAPAVFARSGKPTILIDDLYAGSGEFLAVMEGIRNETLPVVGVASSDFKDVVRAVHLFEVIKSLEQSKILVVTDGADLTPVTRKVQELFGTMVEGVSSDEVNAVYRRIRNSSAQEWADKWIKEAKKVVEPTQEDILKAAKMYLALKSIMERKSGDAITVNCLGLVYGGKLEAYPCLAFFQLNNEGSTGCCEADVDSTITQLMMRYMTGRPGYISDPVLDTATNRIIYAHCVAMNRAFGPNGPSNPYIIRSHAEDNKGASVQSLLPLGEKITTLRISIWDNTILLHTGKTVANIDDPKGCRTKLAAEVDAKKMLRNWTHTWHRVTFYGDWREDVKNFAKLKGLKVIEEDA